MLNVVLKKQWHCLSDNPVHVCNATHYRCGFIELWSSSFLRVLFLGFEIWEVPIRSNDPLLLYYVHFQENRCWYRALGHLRDAGFTNF